MENGYAIWDFRGQEMSKLIIDKFKQFLWRPRPPSLLTKEQKRLIRRNLREFSKAFDEEDALTEGTQTAELLAQRKRLVDEWNAWRVRCEKERAEERRDLGRKPHAAEPQEDKEELAVWIDEVVEEIIEEVVE